MSAEPAKKEAEPPAWPGLDGLRGVLCVLILLFHTSVSHHQLSDPVRRLLALTQGWFLSLDVFFVLSGFLITYLLWHEHQATGGIRLGRFYARRALRLLPALVVLLVALGLLTLLLPEGPAAEVRKAIGLTFIYMANWARCFAVPLGPLDHAWSLSVEEQFYILWPPLYALALRRGVRGLPWLLGGVILLCSGARWVLSEKGWATVERLYNGLDTRGDALLIGCLLAVLFAASPPMSERARSRLTLAAFAAAATFFAFGVAVHWRSPVLYRGGLTLIAVASAVVILRIVAFPPGRLGWLLTTPPLTWLGRRSYGVYLYHYPIYFFFDPPGWSWPATNGVRVVLTLVAVTLSYELVERPFLRLKRRFAALG